MRWLSLAEVLELHRRLILQSGGSSGLRDLGLLEASLAQPNQTFGGIDLYQGLTAKAACLGFSLIQNHPFVDGNKRIGHAAMELTRCSTDLNSSLRWTSQKQRSWQWPVVSLIERG